MRALASLKELDLGENIIGDDGIKALADACASGALDNLKDLVLSNNQISDAGLSALAKAITPGPNGKGALPKCTRIVLVGNPASDEAKQAVRDAISNRK